MANAWYDYAMPGIFLLFYWIAKALRNAPAVWRQRLEWGLVIIALYCLVTARLFTGYPNLLNFSRNPIVDPRTAIRVGRQVPYFHQLLADYPEAIRLPVQFPWTER